MHLINYINNHLEFKNIVLFHFKQILYSNIKDFILIKENINNFLKIK